MLKKFYYRNNTIDYSSQERQLLIDEQNLEYEDSLRRDREKDRLLQEERRREEEAERLKKTEEELMRLENEQEEKVLMEIKRNLIPEYDDATAESQGTFPSFY